MARTPLFRAVVRALEVARRANLAEAGERPPRPRQGPSRREVMAGAAAGAALAAAGTLAGGEARAQARPRRVAVIGAGISGLSAAHHLLAKGYDVRVLEARNRVGGRMHSVVGPLGEGGLIADLGAEFVNTDHTDIRDLAHAYAVELFDRSKALAQDEAFKSAFLFGGRRVSMPDLAAALKDIAAQITADADRADKDEAALAEIDATTVTAYLTKHHALVSNPLAVYALEAGIRTEYGLEPSEASAISLIYNLPTVDGERLELIAADEVYSIVGGSQALPLAIAKKLGDRVSLRARIIKIEFDATGVTLTRDNKASARFDAAIVTMPFPPLRGVELVGDLPADFRRFIGEFGPGRNEKLIAAFKGRPWRESLSFAGEAWSDGLFPLVWDTSLRQDLPEAALTVFFGGDSAIAAGEKTADSVYRGVLQELSPHMAGLAEAATGKYVKTAWGRDENVGGAYACYRPGQVSTFGSYFWSADEGSSEHKGPVFGRLAFAGEHLSADFGGYMNGAANTGRLAAEVIDGTLSGK